MNEDPTEDVAYEELSRFLREAVAEALRTEDGEKFLAWMCEEAPRRAPKVFAELEDAAAQRGLATEIGRTLWNGLPLPGNGFRPRPIAKPERNDPCPCGSGRKYKKCCAVWADGAPDLEPDAVWTLAIEAFPQETVEALGESGRVPRNFVGAIAADLLDGGDALRALALVRPLFARPERLDERDSASLNTLLEAYEALDLRGGALGGGGAPGEGARARRCAPCCGRTWRARTPWPGRWRRRGRRWSAPARTIRESPALGPLEVSLLLAEGRTAEAGERARHWRGRLREGELTEQGFEFLARVGENPEETQLRFAFGDEVTERIHQLESLAGRGRAAGGRLRDRSGAGRSGSRPAGRAAVAPGGGGGVRGGLLPGRSPARLVGEEEGGLEERAGGGGLGSLGRGPRRGMARLPPRPSRRAGQRRRPRGSGPCRLRDGDRPLRLPGPAAAPPAPRPRARRRAAGAGRPPRDHPPAERRWSPTARRSPWWSRRRPRRTASARRSGPPRCSSGFASWSRAPWRRASKARS